MWRPTTRSGCWHTKKPPCAASTRSSGGRPPGPPEAARAAFRPAAGSLPALRQRRDVPAPGEAVPPAGRVRPAGLSVRAVVRRLPARPRRPCVGPRAWSSAWSDGTGTAAPITSSTAPTMGGPPRRSTFSRADTRPAEALGLLRRERRDPPELAHHPGSEVPGRLRHRPRAGAHRAPRAHNSVLDAPRPRHAGLRSQARQAQEAGSADGLVRFVPRRGADGWRGQEGRTRVTRAKPSSSGGRDWRA